MSGAAHAAAAAAAGKTFLITGGNTGIGYEAAKALYLKNAHVIIASKTKERGQEAVKSLQQIASTSGSVDMVQMDLASFGSIKDAVAELKQKKAPISVLVNNAGVFIPPDDRTEEDFEITLGVNHFGPFLLTHLLLDILEANKPSRIINLGSVTETVGRSDWLDLLHGRDHKDERSGIGIYGTTKLFNIMLAKEFSRRLKQRGIDGFACHPGIARTDLYAKNDKSKPEGVAFDLFQKVYYQSAEDGSVSILRPATDPDLQGQGFKYFGPPYKGPALLHINNDAERGTTNPIADDDDACKRLYEETFKIVADKEPAIRQYYMEEAIAHA